jgi:hypothetical protein
MLEGPVWVYAKIQDESSPVYNYSDGPLVIDHFTGVGSWRARAGDPERFALESVYPNPFNAGTAISFSLPLPSEVALRIYDSLGRLRETLYSGSMPAGYHQMFWRPEDLPSGMYLVELQAGGQVYRAKAVFMK